MLRDPRSWAENPTQSIFGPAQIKEFTKRAQQLNAIKQGDQAAFYLRKAA